MHLSIKNKVRNVHYIFGETGRRKELQAAAIRRRQKWQDTDGREELGNFKKSYTRASKYGSMAQT
jgi:hypothetical protein